MKRILFLANHALGLYNFRLEIIERFISEGYEVHISSPNGERIEDLVAIGAIFHSIEFDRHGMNPIKELEIIRNYKNLFKLVKPDICLGYTIKPNIYGAMVARKYRVPFVANITGLGTAVEKGGLSQKLFIMLYKWAFGTSKGKIKRVFFQNEENERFFKVNRIALDKHTVIPGSGVNVDKFAMTELPECGDGKTGVPVRFAFISRIMIEKGVDLYLEAAKRIKENYACTEFHIGGFFEPEYDRTLFEKYTKDGIIVFDGVVKNVAEYMSNMHCIVHPTYYPEGLSNVLLEASSCGRPIITTDRAGCRDVCSEGTNGYLVPEKDVDELTEAIKKFLATSYDQKCIMGKAGRKIAEEKFNRQIIVNAYMNEVNTI